MKKITISFLGMMLLFLTLCQKTATQPLDPKPIVVNVKTQQLIQNNNRFGLELFQSVLKNENAGKNVMISPLSVTLALAMYYNDAAGSTKTVFENVFHFNGLSDIKINHSLYDLCLALTSVDAGHVSPKTE